MITVFAVAYSKKSFNLSLESKSELNWDYHSIELLQMSFVWWVISNYAMEKYFPEFVIKAHKQCPSPAGINCFKVNNGKTRTMCEIYSKLTIKTPERRHWRRSSVFIANFEQIWHIVLVYIYKYYLGLIQDLNLGGDMDVSSSCSIANVKKLCSKIGLLIGA